jgi:hypothetical protein
MNASDYSVPIRGLPIADGPVFGACGLISVFRAFVASANPSLCMRVGPGGGLFQGVDDRQAALDNCGRHL